MTRAARDRAAKVRASRAPAQPAEPPADDPQVPASRLGGYVRTDPVRWTVDLPPTTDVRAKAWRDETSVWLGLQPGRKGVTSQAMLLAAVELVLTDETTARRLRKRLAQEYGRQ